MHSRRRYSINGRRGFTLLELLVVVAIIAVLATLILGGLAAARRRTKVALAKNNIASLKAALQMYETDTGRYPRRPFTGSFNASVCFQNDISFVYAALRNRRTKDCGGGPNSPYMDWKPEQVGFGTLSDISAPDFGNVTNNPGAEGFPRIDAIDQKSTDLSQVANQTGSHAPGGSNPPVFLDPWGNPLVYREWASVPTATKDGFVNSPQSRTSKIGSDTGSGESHPDKPHDISKFDIYSFGPNGVNEYGEGDDVTSWGEK